ncbi:hypothetical protein J6590_010546 [Homalodisca vitripennis]|nr:hypothetical protein J6590_010546 [Homalodisca vitripennis]
MDFYRRRPLLPKPYPSGISCHSGSSAEVLTGLSAVYKLLVLREQNKCSTGEPFSPDRTHPETVKHEMTVQRHASPTAALREATTKTCHSTNMPLTCTFHHVNNLTWCGHALPEEMLLGMRQIRRDLTVLHNRRLSKRADVSFMKILYTLLYYCPRGNTCGT